MTTTTTKLLSTAQQIRRRWNNAVRRKQRRTFTEHKPTGALRFGEDSLLHRDNAATRIWHSETVIRIHRAPRL